MIHWTTNFYKSHVTEMNLVISYQFVCGEHEYDIQIAKLALVFCNYNVKKNFYIMKCTPILIGLQLISVQKTNYRLLLRFLHLSLVQLFGNISGVSISSSQPAL